MGGADGVVTLLGACVVPPRGYELVALALACSVLAYRIRSARLDSLSSSMLLDGTVAKGCAEPRWEVGLAGAKLPWPGRLLLRRHEDELALGSDPERNTEPEQYIASAAVSPDACKLQLGPGAVSLRVDTLVQLASARGSTARSAWEVSRVSLTSDIPGSMDIVTCSAGCFIGLRAEGASTSEQSAVAVEVLAIKSGKDGELGGF